MTVTSQYPPEIQAMSNAWQAYIASVYNWQTLVKDVKPEEGGCGLIYELPSPLDRPGEDFAIADMRILQVAEPHFHPADNWEVYIAFQGTANVFIADSETRMQAGDALIIPPNTAHYTLPDDNFVIAVINKPPFKPENYIKLTESDPSVQYDHAQFLARAH